VLTWGSGIYGALGHPDNERSFFPRVVACLRKKSVRNVSLGSESTFFVTSSSVYGSGVNQKFRFGQGDSVTSISSPTRLSSLEKLSIECIAQGVSHTLAISGKGSRYPLLVCTIYPLNDTLICYGIYIYIHIYFCRITYINRLSRIIRMICTLHAHMLHTHRTRPLSHPNCSGSLFCLVWIYDT